MPRWWMKAAAGSARFKMQLQDGTVVTDWRAAAEYYFTAGGQPYKAFVPEAHVFRNVVLGRMARDKQDARRRDRIRKEIETIGGKQYTRRQLEHLGDAVLDLVARMLIHSNVGTNQWMYFRWPHRLVSNENLATATLPGGPKPANEVEIEIGRVLADGGVDAAMKTAGEIICSTTAWKSFAWTIQSRKRIA